MASNRSQNPLFNILSGLGEMTAGGLHGYGAGKQAIAQQDQLKNLRESLGQQGYDTANLNPNQLQSLAYESAKAAPGKVAEQQKEMSGLANTSQLIKRAQELYEGTNTPETFGFLPKTESYRELDSILKKLKSNPYIKESGGVIPEASSRGVVPKLLNEAQEKLIEKYGQKLPQPQQTSQPSPQQDETPKLPQELVQPKSVQEKQQQQGSGLPLGLAGEAGSGVLGIPSLLARLGSGIQGAVSPLMPGHQTDPAQARAMLEKMGVPEDLIKQSESSLNSLEIP